MERTCKACGLPQPLTQFPFVRQYQTYRSTCKACRAAALRRLRQDPAHRERRRETERQRSAARRPAIRAWERAHPDQLRPGRQRRQAARRARLRAARLAAQLAANTTPPAEPPPATTP